MTRKQLLWSGIALVALVSISQPWILAIVPAAIHTALRVLSNMLYDFADQTTRTARLQGLDEPFATFLVWIPSVCIDALLGALWIPTGRSSLAEMSMSRGAIVFWHVVNLIEVAAVVWLVRRLARGKSNVAPAPEPGPPAHP